MPAFLLAKQRDKAALTPIALKNRNRSLLKCHDLELQRILLLDLPLLGCSRLDPNSLAFSSRQVLMDRENPPTCKGQFQFSVTP